MYVVITNISYPHLRDHCKGFVYIHEEGGGNSAHYGGATRGSTHLDKAQGAIEPSK